MMLSLSGDIDSVTMSTSLIQNIGLKNLLFSAMLSGVNVTVTAYGMFHKELHKSHYNNRKR